MIIDYQIIPHRRQRYDTVGDYYGKHGAWNFRVSRMKDYRYEVLVFLHEIIEFMLVRLAGIKLRDIDRWDRDYEKWRQDDSAPCGCKLYEEPGDDPHAPYHLQHVTATKCERLIADALGVKWSEYNAAVEAL